MDAQSMQEGGLRQRAHAQQRSSGGNHHTHAAAASAPSPGAAAAPGTASADILCRQCSKTQQQQQQAVQAQQQPASCGKPRWRGVIHSYACAAMLSAGAMLVVEAQSPAARWCALVYVAAAAFQFFISGLYHTGSWQPGTHKLLQRIDHSAIFVLIAATYTPLVVVPLGHDPMMSRRLLVRVWVAAVCGGIKVCLFPHGPRYLSTLAYVAMGWIALPYLPQLAASVDAHVVLLIILGGVLYTAGALVFAARYPDPWPSDFGYHEIFHAAVVAATICHFAACYHVLAAAGGGSGCNGLPASPAAVAAAEPPEGLSWQHLVVAGA